MKLLKVVLLFATALLLVACTEQELYMAVQENRQHECQKLPSSAYGECIQQHSEPYDEYESKRQEVLEKHN